MTSLVYDYADIRARMKGDLKPESKPTVAVRDVTRLDRPWLEREPAKPKLIEDDTPF